MSPVMLMIPRRVQLTETDAGELSKRLEAYGDDRGAANAISRLRFALADDQEQTLTPTETAAIHAVVTAWLSEDPPSEPATRVGLEKLQRATSPI
jgi:hypothetical protein